VDGPGAGTARPLAGAGAGAGSLSSLPAPVAAAPELPLPPDEGAGEAGSVLLLTVLLLTVMLLTGGLAACIRPIDTRNTMTPVARLAACWRSLWRRRASGRFGLAWSGFAR
jgi:hypothetical protein